MNENIKILPFKGELFKNNRNSNLQYFRLQNARNLFDDVFSSFGQCDTLIDIELPNSLNSPKHMPFENCSNIERLDLQQNKLTKVPKMLCIKFQRLVSLDLSLNNITMLKPSDFTNCNKLLKLNITQFA